MKETVIVNGERKKKNGSLGNKVQKGRWRVAEGKGDKEG
jgi:hypothetical protein